MKKLLVVGAVALFASMNAQMEKNSWIVSGKTGIDFNSSTSKYSSQGNSIDGPKVSTFSISPSVGYFVVDNLAIGVDLGFNSTKTTFTNAALDVDYTDKTSTFTILPNATYYFPTASKVRPYLGAGVGYGSLTGYNEITDTNSTNGGFLWGAKGGLVYLVNSNIGLDLGAGYSSFTVKQTEQNIELKTVANTFGVSAGVSIFFK